MEQYSKNNQGLEQFKQDENFQVEVGDTTEINDVASNENLDLKGGRVLNAPDFVDLAGMGFSENELKTLVRLRRRFEEGGSDLTPEHQRLRFARWLYQNGRLDS